MDYNERLEGIHLSVKDFGDFLVEFNISVRRIFDFFEALDGVNDPDVIWEERHSHEITVMEVLGVAEY
jgi:hypothetical protein